MGRACISAANMNRMELVAGEKVYLRTYTHCTMEHKILSVHMQLLRGPCCPRYLVIFLLKQSNTSVHTLLKIKSLQNGIEEQ